MRETNDRFFNAWRSPLSPNARRFVDALAEAVQAYERVHSLRERKRRRADQETFMATVEALGMDLAHYVLTGDQRRLVIPRSKRLLTRADPGKAPAFNKTLPDVLDRLARAQTGFITQTDGQWNRNGEHQRTSIAPTDRFRDLLTWHEVDLGDIGQNLSQPSIILKGWKDMHGIAPLLPVPNTTETAAIRVEMERINAWIAGAELEFDEAALERETFVDTNQRFLRRVFTRGSLTSGGRMFGGFWMDLTKEERRKGLTINGEPVVALDYAQMGPRILYGLAKAGPPSGDLYNIPGISDLPGGNYREGIKKVMSALTFATEPLMRKPKGSKHLLPKHLNIREIVTLMKRAHPAIAHMLETDIGHHVQFVESKIVTGILSELAQTGETALPVHDCLLTTSSEASQVKSTMAQHFYFALGIDIHVSEE